MSSNKLDILNDAIARSAGAVLSLPSAGILRHHKSRFLAPAAEGFWIESVASEQPLVEELIRNRHPAGISFKSGTLKVIFTTPVLQHELSYRINVDMVVPALLMATPAQVKAVQRRNNYRVAVPAGADLSVKVWRIAERTYLRDRPMASQQVKCELRDISLGGIGVTFRGEKGEPPKVSTEDRLRIELSCGGTSFLLEGRMRKPTPVANADRSVVRSGITFKALDQDLQGRQTLAALTRVVGTLQREEVRRHRLGIAAA